MDLSVQVLQQYHYNEGIIPVYKIFTVHPGRMSKHIVTQGVLCQSFSVFVARAAAAAGCYSKLKTCHF